MACKPMSPAGPRSLHVVTSLRLSAGGPVQSVTALCEALNAAGAPAEIVTVTDIGEHSAAPVGVPVHSFPLGIPAKLRRSPALSAFLRREASRFDLIHVHGLWEWPCVDARRAAVRHGLPLVVSPRGSLEPWSLRQRAWLKRVALATWEGRNLSACSLLHATARAEAEQLRRLGLTAPIAVVPNGLVFPPAPEGPRSDPPIALFLARLHPKKGADMLLRAWAKAAPSGWRLVLAGPDADGHRAELEALVTELGLIPQVEFAGPMYEDAKWRLFAQARLFLLPSHSENFGNTVIEALSQGLPVIATQGTPWQGLQTHGCGWWVPARDEFLADALREATAMDSEALAAMGRRGQAWAREAFSAEVTAEGLLRAYTDLCAGRVETASWIWRGGPS